MTAVERAGLMVRKEVVEQQKKGNEERVTKIENAAKSMRCGRKVKMYKTDGSIS